MSTRFVSREGFTLLELLLYVAIVGSLMTGMIAFFGVCIDARVKNQTISEVNGQGSYAMDVISQTIRNATAISAPAAGTSGSSLTLTVPTSGLSPTVFSLSGGVLSVTEGANPPVSLTSSLVNVSSLTFTNLSSSGTVGTLQIQMTLDRVNPGGRPEYSFARTFITSASLRP